MTKKIISTFAALLLASGLAVGQQGKPAKTPATTKLQVTQCALKVDGMTCSGCEGNVQKGLLRLDGVKAAKADAKTGDVVVKYDSKKTTPEKIVAAFNQDNSGYRAALPKPKAK